MWGCPSTPTFADIDGDGLLDLVVGEFIGTLRYYENTGTASDPVLHRCAAAPRTHSTASMWGNLNSAPTFADIDGDGDQDLVVGEIRGALNYYENTGTASAPTTPRAPAPPTRSTASM